MASPLVSVLMSVYNGERFLRESVESILRQSFQDYEVILIDDASTDGTAAICLTLNDPRVRTFRNTKNLGIARSLNRALGEARGAFIARLDADDVAEAERLRLQLKYLQKRPELAVCATSYSVINEEGKCVGAGCPGRPRAFLEWRFLFENTVAHSSIMARRPAYLSVGGYNEQYRHAQDFDLWSRMLERGLLFDTIPRSLVRIRNQPCRATKVNRESQNRGAESVSARNLGQLLGRSVHETLAATLSSRDPGIEPSSPPEEALSLLHEVHRRFLDLRPVDPISRVKILRDVTQRSIRLHILQTESGGNDHRLRSRVVQKAWSLGAATIEICTAARSTIGWNTAQRKREDLS